VLAEVAQFDLDELRRRGRDERLAAVSCGGDAGGAVDVSADVAVLGQERRAGVETDPHGDRAGRQRLGEGTSRADRSRSGRKGEEESVSLRVDLDSTLGRTRFPDHKPMLGQRLRVGLRSELVQELRRALDVGKEEGDSPRGKIASHRLCPPAVSACLHGSTDRGRLARPNANSGGWIGD
jgi:hypothetical protein